jgi:transcriptional regulator GlxA family with amidase domain
MGIDAGATAGIDLALALVEEDLGRDVGLAVARYFVVAASTPRSTRTVAATCRFHSLRLKPK